MRPALAAWSLIHGIAKLAVSERLPFQSAGEILKFAEWAIDRSLPSIKRLRTVPAGARQPNDHIIHFRNASAAPRAQALH